MIFSINSQTPIKYKIKTHMSEFFCIELMYVIMKHSDPHTYIQLISTCHDMNELGKPLKIEKVEASLRVIVEESKRSTVLPNGQYHGITEITGRDNVKYFQDYTFGKLMSETVYFSNVISNPNFSICSCMKWESHVYIKTYNYLKNQFVLKVSRDGEVCYEGEYLIDTKEKHGTIRTYGKKYNVSSFEIFHRNKLFYSECFLGSKIFQKVRQLDDFHYQVISYMGSKSYIHIQRHESRPIGFFQNINVSWLM
jgi:hypothetical protein